MMYEREDLITYYFIVGALLSYITFVYLLYDMMRYAQVSRDGITITFMAFGLSIFMRFFWPIGLLGILFYLLVPRKLNN